MGRQNTRHGHKDLGARVVQKQNNFTVFVLILLPDISLVNTNFQFSRAKCVI